MQCLWRPKNRTKLISEVSLLESDILEVSINCIVNPERIEVNFLDKIALIVLDFEEYQTEVIQITKLPERFMGVPTFFSKDNLSVIFVPESDRKPIVHPYTNFSN